MGSYRLVRQLRTSQTCLIWEAVNDTDHVRRVLKVLRSQYYKDRDQISQMRNEFQVGRDLDHPRVIHIYDFQTDRSGAPYLALEYFTPQNLTQAIRESDDNMAQYMEKIITQAAEGLGYLHSQGFVHRDVKPDNFLVNEEGDVKLIDFSIATKQKRGLGKLLSGRGKIQGTRSYMSPEQIRGASPDPRADIYSFGCMVYEIVGGKTPFTGTSANELLNKQLKSTAPSLAAVNEQVTQEFAALVSRLLQKEPDARPATMEEFLTDFRDIKVFRGRKRSASGG